MRLYADALTQQEIADLKYEGQPETSEATAGTSNKSLLDALARTLATYDWLN